MITSSASSGRGTGRSGTARSRETPTPSRGSSRAPRPSPARRRGARRSLEDLRGAVAALEAHLVRPRGAARPLAQVDEEVLVDLHPAVRVAVHAEQPRAEPRVELVVPGR